MTWKRIDVFLPQLKNELFQKEVQHNQKISAVSSNVDYKPPVFGVLNQLSNSVGPSINAISTVSRPENTCHSAQLSKNSMQEVVKPLAQKNSIILQPPQNLLHEAASQLLVC